MPEHQAEPAVVTEVEESELALAGRVGAYESWARTRDRSARTAPARAAFAERFLDQVDPDRTLPPEEREQRAEAARRAYFARLSLKAAQARREARSRRVVRGGDAA